MYMCPRCGYDTDRRCNLKTHFFRKKVCLPRLDDIPIESLRNDVLNTPHESKCDSQEQHVLEKLQSMQDEINHLKKRLETTCIINNDHSVRNTNTNCNNTINNQQHQHIHIHLTDFGKENISHLTQDFFRECLTNGALGVLQMIEKVWFDEEHPENFNIRLSSLKNMLVQFYKHPEWEICGFYDALDKMITSSQTNIITGSKVSNLECTNELITNMDSIQNLKPEVKRKIKDKCKGHLANRRCKEQ